MRRPVLVALAAALLGAAVPARAAAPPTGPQWYKAVGADWSQASISEADGTKLHADILRPHGLAADAKTPVILSIGPYFNHAGQEGPAGLVQGTPVNPVGSAGPSDRFSDFV